MKLNNKYVFGCLVQWYEVEMLSEYIDSCIQFAEGIENPENIHFDFMLGFQTYLERPVGGIDTFGKIGNKIQSQIDRLIGYGVISQEAKMGPDEPDLWDGRNEDFYNIAAYRRELCDQWCDKVDYVCWGETDSLFPQQTLSLIEMLHQMVANEAPKFIANFAGRKNWDKSWDIITHPLFKHVVYEDTEAWILENEASEKSYMSIDRMNEINNIPLNEVDILQMDEPKADGSCLIISSELIRSGVNIPRSLILCGEDTAFCDMAKIIMRSNFRQYNFNNILRVHNRRHPRKRSYILNEDNPNGFCDDRKGSWWKSLEAFSKYNLENLRFQRKSIHVNEALKEIKEMPVK